jgi:hypothetical protein
MTEVLFVGYIIMPILGITYAVIVGVALFHPDKERRVDAMKVLKWHRFTRRSSTESSQIDKEIR